MPDREKTPDCPTEIFFADLQCEDIKNRKNHNNRHMNSYLSEENIIPAVFPLIFMRLRDKI